MTKKHPGKHIIVGTEEHSGLKRYCANAGVEMKDTCNMLIRDFLAKNAPQDAPQEQKADVAPTEGTDGPA